MLFETKKEAWARNRAESRRAQRVDKMLTPGQVYQLPSGRPARYRFVSERHTLEFVLVDPVSGESLQHGDLSISAAYASKIKPLAGGAEV